MEDKFEFTKSNKIMILVAIISLILFIISLILLIVTLNDKSETIPDLYVEKGKTSTLVATTTALETTTTETTTTSRKMKSPYYDINVSKIANDEIFTRNNLNRDEATKLLNYYYNFINSLYNVNDYSIFDIKTTVNNAKKDEIDSITVDGKKYGIIYNGAELINKIMTNSAKLDFLNISHNNIDLFKYDNKKDLYYRLSNIDLNKEIKFVSLTIKKNTETSIEGTVKFYDANFKENGFTAPQYETTDIRLTFKEDRWKIYEYQYPFYK